MRLLSLVAMLAAAASFTSATGDTAEAWYYTMNNVTCGYDSDYGSLSVLATAPLRYPNGNVTSWYGGREVVYWRSQLQRRFRTRAGSFNLLHFAAAVSARLLIPRSQVRSLPGP
jgi:hypothetical protein